MANQDYSNLPPDIQEDFLKPYLERESLNRGSVTLNPSIPEALKSQVESILYPTKESKEEVIEIKQEDIETQIAEITEIERKEFPEFDGSKLPILTKSQAQKNPPTTQFWLNDGKGNIELVNPRVKIEETTNLVTPTDEQFIAFAPSYISANNTERQLKEGRRRSKVLLGKNDIEYTYNEYKKLSGEMAKRRGLPENYEGPDGWDAAPAHRWLIDITKD